MAGQLDGDINADTLHVALKAIITGEITAQSITIDCRVLGSMVADKHYALSYSPKGQTDKNFVSDLVSFNSQNNFSQIITHNLKG